MVFGEGEPDYLTVYAGRKQDVLSSAVLLYSLGEFEEIVKKEKKGVYIIDSWDDAVPEGIREYCQNNLKREFEIDRLYPVQPRYWTVWVYSWGI